MNSEELNNARTNPDFLNFLEENKEKSIKEKDINLMYETLDSMLVLDLDEEKVNSLYEQILKTAFAKVEKIVSKEQKLNLDDKEHLNYVRAFYEHAIEKWSYDKFDGAKEIIFVLLNIVDDKRLCDSLKVLLINLSNEEQLDIFYENEVDFSKSCEDEKYGYFMIDFNFDKDEFLKQNDEILLKEYKNLNHLLEV
ncbi:MAG: hypothetical protein KGV43_01245 [Arcobacter sp.]|nr:hypothetical protein [Arcobacter sp.]